MPVAELMFITVLFFVAGIVYMVWQIRQVNDHIKVLEQTTFEIRKFEEEEKANIVRLETDVTRLENDEAEMFVARVVPTVAKLENFVMAQLFRGKEPKQVADMLVTKKVDRELAERVVKQVAYYLDFYHKLPKQHHDAHHDAVDKLKATGVGPKMPNIVVNKKK